MSSGPSQQSTVVHPLHYVGRYICQKLEASNLARHLSSSYQDPHTATLSLDSLAFSRITHLSLPTSTIEVGRCLNQVKDVGALPGVAIRKLSHAR